MSKTYYSFCAIPSTGDAVYRHGYSTAVAAMASARAEAKLLLKKNPEITSVELHTLLHRESIDGEIYRRP